MQKKYIEIAEKITRGDVRTATRFIRDIEDRRPKANEVIKALYPYTGSARVVGFTGSPGAGKSTLINAYISCLREQDKQVGVLLVDPTSPFSKGAILGDRIRMQRHTNDPEVFVRSIATRGAVGGLSKAVGNAIHVMDAMGKDVIIVETVGAGQQELDIMNFAHTTIVVLVPGMGDEVQMIKAGMLEIADIFVINKAHVPGTEKLYGDLLVMLHMGDFRENMWMPPIVRTANVEDDSFLVEVHEMARQVEKHDSYVSNNKSLSDEINRRRVAYELIEALNTCILEPIYRQLKESGELEDLVTKIQNGETDPYTCADILCKRIVRQTDPIV